jgi:hypothetical protein
VRLLNVSSASPEYLQRLHEGLAPHAGRYLGPCSTCGLGVTSEDQPVLLGGETFHGDCSVYHAELKMCSTARQRAERRGV